MVSPIDPDEGSGSEPERRPADDEEEASKQCQRLHQASQH